MFKRTNVKIKRHKLFNKVNLIIIVLLFAGVGAYLVINSRAAVTQTNCIAKPSVCGYPDETNTGVPSAKLASIKVLTSANKPVGTTLDSDGILTVTQNGTVIDNYKITGGINVRANNVIIRNSQIITGAYYPIENFGTGLLVEDTEITGTSQGVTSGVAFSNYTARRVKVSGTADGLKADDNVLIEDSYITELCQSPGSHNDGIQLYGNGNVTLRHNTIKGSVMKIQGCIAPEDTTPIQVNSPASNSLFENNLIDGSGYWGVNGDGSNTLFIKNNRFTDGYGKYPQNPIALTSQTCGNYFDTNGQSIDSSCPTSVPAGPTANLWIDQNGGNCVRSENPIEYAGAGDTNSCSSSDINPAQGAFNKAYKVAKPADLILIKQGVYTTQEIDYKTGATSPNVTIQAETAASVKVKELDIQSASYVTFKNFTVIPSGPDAKPDGSGGEAPYNQILDFGTASGQSIGAHHVTLDGVNIDGRQPDGTPSNRDASGINGNTSYVTIKNADFGFIKGRKVMIIQNYGAKGPNDHLELDNVKLHDDPQWPDGSNHLECLWLSSTTNSVFNRLHLYNCALPMILSTFGDDLPTRTTTIQNSIFEASQGYGGSPGYYSIDGCLGRPSAGLFGSLTLKYNYFAIPLGCADGAASEGLKLVGNIGSANNCLSGALYSHNIWSAAKCDSTDIQNAAITNSVNFMKLANPFVNQPGDYRPSSGNAPQVNSGDPTSYPVSDWRAFPSTDAAGNSRPSGGAPDVGPYEYTGSTTTTKLPGDVNLDNTVNIDDLSILLSKWNTNYAPADFYKDNIIDISDLSILLGNWGKVN